MVKSEEKKCAFACLAKPITKHNILYHYIPLHGVATYGALSINIMNPALIQRVSSKDVTNVLLMSTLFGSALYIYGRPHLKALPAKTRAGYSVGGGAMFSLGSVLVWAVIRSFVRQDQRALATALGLGSGAVLVYGGYNYLKHVDSLVPAQNN